MDSWRCGSQGANASSGCGGPGRGQEEEGEGSFAMPSFSTAAKVRVSVTLLLFLVSACSNAAVLWTLSRRGRRRSNIKLLIMNLAIADLLVTVIVMPLDAVWNITVQWYAGDLSCRLLMFLKLVAMYSSAFVTVVISVDRQAAILNPLAIGDAKKRNKLLLSGAWALSVTLALPQSTRGVRYINCLLPSPVSSREVQLRQTSDNIPRARLRTLKLSLVLVLSFILCWTPYYLQGLWYWFCPEMLTREQVPPSLSHILFLFGLLNSSLNPLFYGLFTLHLHREVRQARPEPDTPSLGTGSFRSSPLHRQRGARDRPETPSSPCSSLCKGRVEESLV
ncbi:GNRR2 protein, partial [Polyodon spathula]|nr:GNRR2 protein [Polyodon spathula]